MADMSDAGYFLSIHKKVDHLTKIWEMSRYVFVRLLLSHLRTYGSQIWQGCRGGAQKKSRENEILKFQSVAMEISKFCHG